MPFAAALTSLVLLLEPPPAATPVAATPVAPPAEHTSPAEAAEAALEPGVTAQVRGPADGHTATPSPRFHRGRAALEMGGALTAGVIWYQSQIELNKQDFDFDRTLPEQWRRLSTADGWRFDDNHRYLNVGHAFVGAAYYDLARANHGSVAQSLLFAATTSTLWELGVEHREVVSLNDSLVTPLAGLAIGEPVYRIGRRIGERARARHLPGDGRHRFDLTLGHDMPAGAVADGQSARATSAQIDIDLDELPDGAASGDDAPQAWSGGLGGGDLVRLRTRARGTQGDLDEFALQTRTSLWGLATARAAGGPGARDGMRSFVGLASAFDLAYHDDGPTTDFLTVVHVVGPGSDVFWRHGDLGLRAGLDLYGDFAMVQPFAAQGEAGRAELEGDKSTLRRFAYYYAWGLTGAARLEASYGGARIAADASWSGFDAVRGLDRRQHATTSPTGVVHDAIAHDDVVRDQRLDVGVLTLLPVHGTPVKVGVGARLRRRAGEISDLRAERDDRRLDLNLTYSL